MSPRDRAAMLSLSPSKFNPQWPRMLTALDLERFSSLLEHTEKQTGRSRNEGTLNFFHATRGNTLRFPGVYTSTVVLMNISRALCIPLSCRRTRH
jgi:hypothetical protein